MTALATTSRASRPMSRSPNAQVLVGLATLVAAAVSGLLVVAINDGSGPLARPEFRFVTSLPVAVYPTAGLAVVAATLIRNHWWAGTALFFLWMPFEDLVRKFTGNDLRVYFVKDLLLFVALLGVLPQLRGRWRSTLGNAWLPTMTIFVIAAVMSIPAAVHNASLPLIAFHTRFLFALLLPVGAFIASDRERMRNFFYWLSLLFGAVCLLGVVQAVVGPTFLNPSLEQSPFEHLTVAKTVGGSVVLRPSGTFADVSRFASTTIIAVVLALCSVRLARTRFTRGVSYACVAIALAAAFASASRTALLVAVPLALLASVFPGAGQRRVRARTIGLVVLAAFGAASIGGRFGDVYRATSDFFATTINPLSPEFEITKRIGGYVHEAWAGIASRSGLGAGTGTESLGKRYLDTSYESTGVESGFGTVAAEWGVIGLLAWVVWTLFWIRRAFRRDGSSTVAPIRVVIALYLTAFVTIQFSLGIGSFENYVANALFWLLSGVLFATPSVRRPASRDFEPMPHSLDRLPRLEQAAKSGLAETKRLSLS